MAAAAVATSVAAAPLAAPARAAELAVQPGDDLQKVVREAAAGDLVLLAPGRHAGPVVVDKPLTLRGGGGAAAETLLEGSGEGSVIKITAPDVRIEGLTIRGSGKDTPGMDAGVLATRTAHRALVRGNRFEGNLFGVYLHGAAGSLVEDNVIRGRQDVRLSEAGNGVSIWNAPGARVVGNDIAEVRDGIFVNTSKRNAFEGNRFARLRFAIHYMYTHDSRVIGNRSEGNHIGWAIMFSDRLEVRDNVSIGDRDHGLMLNYANRSEVTGNRVEGGGEKCLFIYNAHRNLIAGNRFEGCPIGIHFTAGSERNRVTGNAFIGNRTQVKYVGTRHVVWTHEGRGNYWSDNPAFDLDGDGLSDRPYRPNDLVDDILWRTPQAKLLLNSPAVQALRFAQSHFPALTPGGVVDSAPLMAPPSLEPAILDSGS